MGELDEVERSMELVTVDEIQQELADAEMSLQHTEDRRAQAWANHDDEGEQLLAMEAEQIRGRIYQLEALLEARA